jgi:hypothetical protein
MPHGYGWFSGNGFPYSGDALIFYIKSELRKWDFKKDMMEGWSATNAANLFMLNYGIHLLRNKGGQ